MFSNYITLRCVLYFNIFVAALKLISLVKIN